MIDHVVTSDGVRLNVRDEGSGEVLLLLPGWGVSLWFFQHQFAPELTDRFRAVAYDPRSQGASEITRRGLRVARLAADLRDVIDAIAEPRVHLLAWSGGGTTALQYIDLYGTGRLASLTLIGSGPRLMKAPDWDLGFMDDEGVRGWNEMVEQTQEAAADFLLPTFFAAPPSPETYATAKADMLRSPGDVLATTSRDFLSLDLRDVLPRIDVPTLIVAGEQDVSIPAGNTPYMAQQIPNARSAVIANASHAVFFEQPDEFNELVVEFVTGV